MRRNSDSGSQSLVVLHETGGSASTDFQLYSDGRLVYENVSAGFTFSASTLCVVADGWIVLGWTKLSGATLPRFHRYKYSTDAYIHENGGGTVSDAGRTAAGVRFGEYEGSSLFNGDLAVAGMWNRVLSDAEFEALPFSLQAWYALGPAALWTFDQSATTQNLVDLTGGGANQSTLTGTAVATAAVPVFSYGFPAWATRTPAAAGAAQDTPELRGRPFGQHGQAQMHQLLAQ